MAMPSLMDGAKGMDVKKRKWVKDMPHEKGSPELPSENAEAAHDFDGTVHERKGQMRDAVEHKKPKKSAEALKKSFYGHKAKE